MIPRALSVLEMVIKKDVVWDIEVDGQFNWAEVFFLH